ncbi:hypothetical protein ACIP5Y_00215 [Nocardia sp. NPDC088792]|uniref:hypothetical protein n=1 Tax=Nocardia sp. NPDC088792 TaxID=3364332 RepID=UPI00382F1255
MAEEGNARKWAHTVLAGMLAEQARAVRANESDLIAFGKQYGRLARAANRRDAAIAAANARFEQVASEAESGAGAALARLHERGMSEPQLCAITGLGAGRIRQLLKGGATRTDSDSGVEGLPVGVVEVEQGAAGDHPAQSGQGEQTQSDGRGPRAVLERVRPMPGQPEEQAKREQPQSAGYRTGRGEHDREQ